MSRASAYIQTPEGRIVAHGLYDGTMDILRPWLAADSDGAWDADNDGTRDDAWERECPHTPAEGYAYSDYGGGFYWPARYCLQCMVVIGPLSPWWVLEGSDAPESWLGVWPKDGTPPIDVGESGQRELPRGSS